jgi:MSHA biogenesis protein MshQ
LKKFTLFIVLIYTLLGAEVKAEPVLDFACDTGPRVIYCENFDSFLGPYSNSNTQLDSGKSIYYKGTHPDWSSVGRGVHTVDLGSADHALMVWQDNVITLTSSIPANDFGKTYTVKFDVSAAVYVRDQGTREQDGFTVKILRDDNSLLAFYDIKPGAWSGDMNFAGTQFIYIGDGTGNVHLQIGPSDDTFNNGHFAGAVNNLKIVRPPIDHYEIVHDGQGLTCDTEKVEVKACIDTNCLHLSPKSVTVDFLADGNLISTPTFTGSTIVELNHSVVETLSLSVSNVSVTAAESFVCEDGSDDSCDIVFTNAGFRFLYGRSGIETETLPNQISGTVFGKVLKLQAVKDTDGVCKGLFNGNKAVGLTQSNVIPSGTNGLHFTINGNAIGKDPVYTTTTLNFGADSIAIIPTPIYHDAGHIRLRAKYDAGGVVLTGISNKFWVSPAELVVSAKSALTNLNAATSIASTTHKAGDDFELIVNAYNSLGVITPNYSPGQIQFKLARTAPTLSASVDGHLTYAAAASLVTNISPVFQNVSLSSFSSGISRFSAAQYSEVGLVNLEVQDNNYGNTGIVIPADTINIGRFIPDHFEQTVVEDGYFYTTCNTGTTFAYSGQKDEADNTLGTISYLTNPILAITAYNKQGDITQNYYEDTNQIQNSANDFMKLSATQVKINAPTADQVAQGVDTTKLPLTANMNTGILSQHDLTTLGPDNNPLPKGVLHYQLSDNDNFFYKRSPNTHLAPFTSDIDFSINTIIDEDSVSNTTTVAASPEGVEIRFGRLTLENSFGSEISNLTQPMQTEHFDGTRFVVSTNNDCVKYNVSDITLTNISLDPELTNLLGGTRYFVSGKARGIELEAPGAGNRGKIGVSYNTKDWLKYDWNNDGLYNNNPSGTATFGVYRGNDRIISWREVFN